MMSQIRAFLQKNPWVIQVFWYFVIWRVVLFGLSIIAPQFFSYEPSFPYSDVIFQPYELPQWLYSWANFDGVHYLTIIDKGYLSVNFIQAFFPAYPLSVSALNNIVDSSLLNGLLISNVAALGVFWVWFYLVRELYSPKLAWVSLLVLTLFPTAFFLVAFYNESLFLLLILSSFLAARKQRWWLAGILAAIASATRVVGVFMVPALALEWWLQYRETHKNLPKLTMAFIKDNYKPWLAIALGGLGLLAYMAYLHRHFNDALYFFHVQSEFGSGRQENIVLYPQVLWRSLKILLTARPFDERYLIYLEEFLAGVFGVVLLIIAWFKKIRASYILFAVAAFLVPTLTGTFSSMGRYLLVCFPIFIVIAQLLHNRPKLMVGYLIVSGLVLAINVVLFIQGYWVA